VIRCSTHAPDCDAVGVFVRSPRKILCERSCHSWALFHGPAAKKKLDEFSLEKAPHGGEFVVVHVEYREEFCDL